MHTTIQLDPNAEITVREKDEFEILILDPNSECSSVIRLSVEQMRVLNEEYMKIVD